MPLHIYQQAIGANNWPFAAAISVVFTAAVMIVIYALNRVGEMNKAYGTV
jgi:putative spermidine/putrescine transport system permease protein